jgi:hypothetical protein
MSKDGRPSIDPRRLSIDARRLSKDALSLRLRPARLPLLVFFTWGRNCNNIR